MASAQLICNFVFAYSQKADFQSKNLKEAPITKVITCMKISCKIKNGISVKDIDTSSYIVV